MIGGHGMSVLSHFADEFAGVEASPQEWAAFVRVIRIIDRNDNYATLRGKLERIARKRVGLQDRCAAMLPLLEPLVNAELH